mmetsp:Transcript_7498/g.28171  ORF Transcript_7498/g.28171 Transcript_7498/m.28171 type:complete len:236 (+) Transcript_7498:129-836(+)
MSVADACLGARPTLVRVSRAAAPKGGSVNSRTPLITAFNPKKTGGGGGAARLFRVHTANARARATNVTPGATASSNPPAGSEQSSDPDLDVHKQHASRSRWPQERRINLAARNLRALLLEPGIIQTPCAHDALSASLIEKAGFSAGFMSGFCVSAARLAMPDAGLISYGEMEVRIVFPKSKHCSLPLVECTTRHTSRNTDTIRSQSRRTWGDTSAKPSHPGSRSSATRTTGTATR